MLEYAWKTLTQGKIKFLAGAASVSLAIALVLTLLGIYNGIIQQSRAMPEQSGADY